MKFLWLLLWLFSPVVWADFQATPDTPVDLMGLTSEFKQAVPALEGCDDTQGTITCRRLTEDFTDAEKAAMGAALVIHDPAARQKRQSEHEPVEIPLGDFGAGAAGALAVLAGRGLVIQARKKKPVP